MLARANTDFAQLRERLEDPDQGILPLLQGDLQKLEERQLQARRHLEAVASVVDNHPLKKDVEKLQETLFGVTGDLSGAANNRAALREDVDHLFKALEDV